MLENLSVLPYLQYLPVALAVLFVYFFPAYLALVLRHKDAGVITWTNFLIGWSVGGWFAVLVWAADPPRD